MGGKTFGLINGKEQKWEGKGSLLKSDDLFSEFIVMTFVFKEWWHFV